MRAAVLTTVPADSYLGRLAELRALIDEVAPATWSDPRWWALVSTIAAAETRRAAPTYLLSDAALATDTCMAWPSPRPNPFAEAVALARAARDAVAALDGALIDQPLAGTIAIGSDGARIVPTPLDAVAVAVGSQVALAPLAATDADLIAALTALARGSLVAPLVPLDRGRPFCTIAVGDDAWPTARHGHRRGWVDPHHGPWLGLARSGDHLIASTCHYAIDGYGHGLLAGRIANAIAPGVPALAPVLPPLAPVAGATPLASASRRWPGPAQAVHLAYRLGVILGEDLGIRRGMAPTIQIPVAPGERHDADRWRRRAIPALVSVRWTNAGPEAPEAFAQRARAAIAREAAGRGLASRVYAAGRALPIPIRWKRRVATSPSGRPSLFSPLYDVVAGRACLSVIPSAAAPPLIAISAPSRADATGSTVVTLVDSGAAGVTITVTGTGRWATDAACAALIDRLLP